MNQIPENGMIILKKRYLKDGETADDMFNRVAKCVASVEKTSESQTKYAKEYHDIMSDLDFLANSPTLMNAGTEEGQLAACFVLPVEDDMEAIFESIKQTAIIHKSGGGTGFDFSSLRPKNSRVNSTNGVASGPVSFMKVFDAATEAVKQGGKRRGANMGVLRIDHPDILEFINCKTDDKTLDNFNISVAVTDEFMKALGEGKDYMLMDKPGSPYKEKRYSAKMVWNELCNHAWKNGDPGVLFIDTINKFNPCPDLGPIEATNPCFAGFSRILTNDGYKSFENIYAAGGKFMGINKDGTKYPGKVWFSGRKETICLTIAKRRRALSSKVHEPAEKITIQCTPDHVFMLSDGTACLAKHSEGKDLASYDNTDEYRCEVIAISPAGHQPVYDFSEPLTNWGVVEGIIVHNCGETPLLRGEQCSLGSINLSHMLKKLEDVNINSNICVSSWIIDYTKLNRTVQLAVRFLDSVIDATHFPLQYIEERTKLTRKIGLGVMGFADMLAMLGVPYDSDKALEIADEVMTYVNNTAKQASEMLAKERGAYPAWHEDQSQMHLKPIRNAVRTVIAPTGTISTIAGCWGGIEPFYSLVYEKHVMDGTVLKEVNPYLVEALKKSNPDDYNDIIDQLKKGTKLKELPIKNTTLVEVFKTAGDISPENHLKMQAVFQQNTDNAVSKTINLPNSASQDDIDYIYKRAWALGIKGVTVYRDGSKSSQVYYAPKKENKIENKPKQSVQEQTETPKAKEKTPDVAQGIRIRKTTGCGKLYVHINKNQSGVPIEVFADLGKAGGCPSAFTEGVGRLASLSLKHGATLAEIRDELSGVGCARTCGLGPNYIASCVDGIGKAIHDCIGVQGRQDIHELFTFEPDISKSAEQVTKVPQAGACPVCGGVLDYVEGCRGGKCRNPACEYYTCG